MTTFDANNTMDKYAIYLRKSRADIDAERDGDIEDSLARHKMILTEVAARRGLYVEKIYQEIVSGETIEARPEIQKLINDCYAGKYKGIIIVDITRLSRGNQGDAQTILDCLRYSNANKGILIVTPTKTYDVANNPDDEEYMEFELFMSRREYKMIRKRMTRGKMQAIIEGNFLATNRPYGYNILKTKSGRTLIPNEHEAPVVKQIFEWIGKEHMTAGEVARRLTAMGVPTYSGAPEWNMDSIKQITTNPVYTGKIRWNDRMTVKHLVDGELAKSRPRGNRNEHYIEVEGKHAKYALVSQEIYDAASSRVERTRTRSDRKPANPLAGLIYCSKCGFRMQQHDSGRGRSRRITHRRSKLCNVKSAATHDVVDAVVHALKLYIEDFEMKIDNTPDIDENSLSDQMDALDKEKRKIEKKLMKLFDSWENDEITNNEFAQRKAVHNARLEAIKIELEKLEDTVPEKEEYTETLIKLSDALNALRDESVDVQTKNIYLKQIVGRIDFSRENDDEFMLDMYLK